MTFMKYLLTLFLMLGINLSVLADDQDTEHTHENDYEDGCDNDLDDDMDIFDTNTFFKRVASGASMGGDNGTVFL